MRIWLQAHGVNRQDFPAKGLRNFIVQSASICNVDFTELERTVFKHHIEKAWADWLEKISPEVLELVRRSRQEKRLITKAEYEELYATKGLNSYERDLLMARLENAALIALTELYVSNIPSRRSKFTPASTYDEALASRIVPLLIARLKQTEQQVAEQSAEDQGELA